MPAQVTELKVQDVAIKLHSAGRGPTVLFLHGAGGVPQRLPFFDALAESFELLVPEVSAFRWCHEDRLADEKKIFGRVCANPAKSDLHRTRSTTHTASSMLELAPRVTAGRPGQRDRILPGYEGRGPRSAWMFSNSQL
jgi:hypothetical protein